MNALALALTLFFGAEATDAPQWLGPKPKGPVKRVVTLAPSLTDTVLALGAGDRLVGVSRFDERPEVKSLPRVGGFVDPSVEAVLALKPDLVLVQPGPGNQQPVEKMAELGAPVLLLPLHSVAQVLVAIREAGRALGREAEGKALAERIEQARAGVHERAKALPHPRVLFVYGWEPLVVAGPGSFADELLRDAGGVNAADQATSPYPVYSVESALRARADVVVNAAGVHEGGGEKLRGMPGLKEARWVELSSLDLLHPGPRLAEGLEELFRLLHPAPSAAPPGSSPPAPRR
ncbi:MAG TPA: helical backbone metal receptor [Myxococcaceae bacterium]|nr:helical backbone metal receptor [Myxococcaceae bacterium]